MSTRQRVQRSLRRLGRPGEAIAPRGSLDASAWMDLGLDGALLDELVVGSGATVAARPELHALAERIQASEHAERSAAGARLPTIAARARLHYGDPGVRIVENEAMEWASAGIELRWTPWDAGEAAAGVRSRAAARRATVERSEVVREQLVAAVVAARQRVLSAREQLDLATQRAELERRRLALVEARSGEGQATESELLDSQDDLSEAEIALAVSQARLRMAEADLLYAVGR